jgi:hypothetical protein
MIPDYPHPVKPFSDEICSENESDLFSTEREKGPDS